MLELVQGCEYGDFNHLFLDAKYDGVKGSDILYFKFKEASRHEAHLPSDPKIAVPGAKSPYDRLVILERAKRIDVRTMFHRDEAS